MNNARLTNPRHSRQHASPGAASIIVVFMILVLFVFGVLSFTMGLANRSLSAKGTQWNTDYYLMERDAEAYIFELDALLISAEEQARQAITRILEQPNPTVETYADIFSRYYYYYACIELQENLSTDPDHVDELQLDREQYLNFNTPLGDMPQPLVYLAFSGNKVKHLLVGLQIALPDYDFSYSGGVFGGIRVDHTQPRYQIIEWREWQEPFDYSAPGGEDQEFWDGTITTD